MPPKVSFTKEMVLDRSFEIVRREGLAALSARKIAEELHCSTRPVYGSFRSMEDLAAAVVEKARGYALGYFARNMEDADSPFLSLGLRYFRFSREEPELFRLLYMEGRMGDTFETMARNFSPLLEQMKRDPRLEGFSEADLKRVGTDSWIYTHGLVALMHAMRPENAEELVRAHLLRFGRSLVGGEHGWGGEERKRT